MSAPSGGQYRILLQFYTRAHNLLLCCRFLHLPVVSDSHLVPLRFNYCSGTNCCHWTWMAITYHFIFQSQMRTQSRGTMPNLRRSFSRRVRKNWPRSTPFTLVTTTATTALNTHSHLFRDWNHLFKCSSGQYRLPVFQNGHSLFSAPTPEKLAEAQRRFATLQNELQSSLDAQRESTANGRGLRRRKTVFTLSQQERCKHRNIKDLQLAFSEFYLSLILLQNYQVHTVCCTQLTYPFLMYQPCFPS